MKRLFLAAIAVAVGMPCWFAEAAESKPQCKDLYAAACADKSGEDLTGFARQPYTTPEIGELVRGQEATMKLAFQKKILAANQKHFRQLAIDVLHPDAGDCNSTDDRRRDECEQQVVLKLVELATVDLSPLNHSSYKFKASVADVRLLMDNAHFAGVVADAKNRITEKFMAGGLMKKIEGDVFPNVKRILAERIEEMRIDPAMREYMANKVRSIEFKGTDCSSVIKPKGIGIDQDFEPNAYYEATKNEYRLCNGLMFSGNSEFHIAYSIAHELAHSIDPCAIQAATSERKISFDRNDLAKAEAQYPISNLLRCLRSNETAAAKRDNSIKFKAQVMRDNQNQKARPVFCLGDQIREAMAEWFASEVSSRYTYSVVKQLSTTDATNALLNTWRPRCRNDSGVDETKAFSSHLPTRTVVNKVFLANPQVRQLLGCSNGKSEIGYCDGDNPKPIYPAAGRVTTVKEDKNGTSR